MFAGLLLAFERLTLTSLLVRLRSECAEHLKMSASPLKTRVGWHSVLTQNCSSAAIVRSFRAAQRGLSLAFLLDGPSRFYTWATGSNRLMIGWLYFRISSTAAKNVAGISFSGCFLQKPEKFTPDSSIKELQTGRFATRRYRNRRIGEFLKELSLTEGRGTGIPKMLGALRANGSPKPV